MGRDLNRGAALFRHILFQLVQALIQTPAEFIEFVYLLLLPMYHRRKIVNSLVLKGNATFEICKALIHSGPFTAIR